MSGSGVVLNDTKEWGEEGIGGKYPFGYIKHGNKVLYNKRYSQCNAAFLLRLMEAT